MIDGGRRLPDVEIRPMAPWRIAGALALATAFAALGLQVQRIIDEQGWSASLMLGAALSGLVAAVCVVIWTWVATDNARRLIGPATNRDVPSPPAAVREWALPFAFVAIAVVIVANVGSRIEPDAAADVSAIPWAVALVALVLAVPMTYRPLQHLAGVVRHVGGHSAPLTRWLWVPVVLAGVGLATLVTLRAFVADDDVGTIDGWGPLWVIAVTAIVPCVIVVLLAWRAGATVEEAISVAARRRHPGSRPAKSRPARTPARDLSLSTPIRVLPGATVLRIATVGLVAGLALLSVVGAIVMVMFWMESNDRVLAPSERERAWDLLDGVHSVSRIAAFAVIVVVALWAMVVVWNARRVSGRRRNPLLAALAWPASAVAIWQIADRFVIDQPAGRVVIGFAAQAAVLAVPFLLIERTAEAVGARRTPIRITYILAVVLLVHIEGLGSVSTLDETTDTTRFGRLAGYLVLGALVQLMATMAVSDACASVGAAIDHEVDHHNMIVAQRPTATPEATTSPGTVAGGAITVAVSDAAVSQ